MLMRRLFRRVVTNNLDFALRQYRKALRLASMKLGIEFARQAYLEILLVLRYVYLALFIFLVPFAAYDVYSYAMGVRGAEMVYFNAVFYVFVIGNIAVLNVGRLHRASLMRLRITCTLAVLLLSLAGTSVTVILLSVSEDLSLFSSTLLAIAILFRFPEGTRYFIYAVNYAILYYFMYQFGIDSPALIQNPLFVLLILLVFDKATYLSMVNTWLKTQRIVQLNKRMMREDMNKTDMLSIAVHDLKSPLSGIMSVTQMMRGNLAIFPDEEKREILAEIEESTNKILNKIEDLMHLASSEVGEIRLHREEINIASLLYAVIQSYNYQASLKGVKCYTKFEQGPLFIKSDRNTVARIFDNLVSNAIKYSRPGSAIFIKARQKREGQSAIQVDIHDEGPGFTEQDRQRIFGRFEKLSARPTGGESSTGIGLYSTYRLVQQLGASITLDSEANKGACFTVTLPAA